MPYAETHESIWRPAIGSPRTTESDNCSLAKSNTLTPKDAAIELAYLDWSVFPVAPKEKRPATKHGFKDSSKDPVTVKAMFENGSYNIGVATGQPSGGIIVIDADVKADQNKNGIEVIQDWQDEHGVWPDTVEATSGGGGRHWYFKVSTEIRNSTNAKLGVDIRGNGGYIIAPPSIHPSGNLYSWLPGSSPFEHEVAEANESVYEFLKYVTEKPAQSTWQEKDSVPEGTRDDELFRACCSWKARGYSYEAMLDMAREYNEQAFVPPLSDNEVAEKVKHVVTTYFTNRSSLQNPALMSKIKEHGVDLGTINDICLSRLFGDLYKDQLRYDPSSKTYLFYNGRYWEVDVDGLFSEHLCKQFIDLLWEYRTNIPDDERHKYKQAVEKYFSRPKRERLLKDTQTELQIAPSQLNANLALLNVANCTINLTTLEVRPHQASDLITQCAPVEYVPEASCERWENVLASTFESDSATIRYFQKAIGMAILGDTRQALFHVVGFTPRSGKSVIFGTLLNLLSTKKNGYACVVPGNTFEQNRKPNSAAAREDLMLMRNTRLAIVHESSQGMLLDAALIKQITGGDLLSARSNYKGFETFSPCCNIFFITNHMPQVTDRTIFASKRLRIIPFNNAILPQDQDVTLKDHLAEPANLSGILNWILEGARLYQEEGLKAPGKIISAIQQVESTTDYAQQFIEDALVPSNGTKTPLAQIHKAYENWCRVKNLPTLEKSEFGSELKAHGIAIGNRTAAMRDPVIGYMLIDSCNSLNPPVTK